ncbi:hypothetical protein BVH01_08875 [Pseudomonas sp. PA1(2017)]|uniref:hypothetical protein n=1 Tax=Pseudomonas sp. PA1(2017) TaxID=1932113 RepID=UPI0009595D6C|nr:hypothetical protein [Pseudomonas sp. PA1(2017)]OLU16687.1 hypothetical protein BVH01_08875 [Pseudomonas sp. PA1(2017)]
MFIPHSPGWEASLVAVIAEELDQLKYLVEDKSGASEERDIHAQLDRLSGLTDLAHNAAIPFVESTRLQIREMDELAMGMLRKYTDLAPLSNERIQSLEREAAQGLFDAIALNIPRLAQGEARNTRLPYRPTLSRRCESTWVTIPISS